MYASRIANTLQSTASSYNLTSSYHAERTDELIDLTLNPLHRMYSPQPHNHICQHQAGQRSSERLTYLSVKKELANKQGLAEEWR